VCRMREEEDREEKKAKEEAEKRKKMRTERQQFLDTRTQRINAWRDWERSVRPRIACTPHCTPLCCHLRDVVRSRRMHAGAWYMQARRTVTASLVVPVPLSAAVARVPARTWLYLLHWQVWLNLRLLCLGLLHGSWLCWQQVHIAWLHCVALT
jgi:hypothetical protein